MHTHIHTQRVVPVQEHAVIASVSAHRVISEVFHVSDTRVINHPLDTPESLGTFFCPRDRLNGLQLYTDGRVAALYACIYLWCCVSGGLVQTSCFNISTVLLTVFNLYQEDL